MDSGQPLSSGSRTPEGRGLSVVIPSRNPSNLKACASAIRQMDPGLPIILVSDGIAPSEVSDSDVDYIVQCPKPFCFARNANLGIVAAGDDDIILANDDSLLQKPGGFRAMQRAYRENPEYGLISAVCLNVGNVNQHPRRVAPGSRFLREEPRMVCFVCVLIPRATIEQVGLMDERFGGLTADGRTIYGHCDNDLCRRVREHGLKIGIYDGCYVNHDHLPSSFRPKGQPSPDLRPAQELYRAKWGNLE